MKRFLSLFLFAILFGSYAFSYEFSAICESGQTLYYNITSATEPYTVEITYPFYNNSTSNPNYYYNTTKPTGDLTIPSYTINNGITYSVTSIRANAFYACSGLTSVIIPNSVTSIDYDAFRSCSGLTSVVFPNSVTNIGDRVFYGCSGLTNPVYNDKCFAYFPCGYATEYTIIDGIQQIAGSAFYSCSGLTSITIPNSVTRIERSAFYNCSGLTSITIPNTVTTIEYYTFSGCSGLTEVTIPNSVTHIKEFAFENCNGLAEVTIGCSVTRIDDRVFNNCGRLTTINFNATNCSIMGNNTGYSAFGYNSILRTINIGNNVTNIPDYAFYNCQRITSITIPNSVTNIGQNAFLGCSGLTEITIPNSVTSIGNNAFKNCTGLTTVNFNASNCSTMGGSSNPVFSGCTSLATLNIGENVTYIPASAFYNCSGLTSVTIPNSVTSIGDAAFYNCDGLTEVTIPNSVTSIDNYAFYGCNGLTTINYNATNCTSMNGSVVWEQCSSLSTINIGENVAHIPNSAFSGCSGLTTVNFNATNCTSMGGSSYPVFNGCNANATINIGEGVTTIPDYAFKGLIGSGTLTIPNSVTNIGQYAFYGCSGLTTVTIPNSVTSIGNYAFYGCSGLTTVTIPNSVTSIGNHAFCNCIGLTSVTIGSGVTNIGNYAFYGCSGLTTINFNATNCTSMGSSSYPVFNGCTSLATLNIGENVTNIPACAFYNCNRLSSITIPSAITNIGNSAFQNCTGITSVNFNATNCTSMGSSSNPVFSGCSALQTINIGNNVTNIPAYAFKGCSGFSSITIPTNVQGIGEYAFQGCTGLETISIPSSVNSIGASALGGCSGLTSVTIPYIGNRADVSATDTYRYPLGYLFGTSSYSGGTSVSQSYYGSSASSTTSSTYYIPSNLRSVTVLDGYIPYGAFQNCSMLTSITIPTSITAIEGNTFYGCSGLTSITIPSTVTSIGANAFYNCSNIANISLPSAVTNIGASAFYNCNHISSITIPNAVTSIGNSAFQNCTGITSVNFNATNCTSIGSSSSPVFSGCTALQTLNISSNVTNIPAYAFYNCNRLSSITIPSAVTNIGNSAFQNCTGITSVNFNATNCTSIGSSSSPVFSGCTALQTLNISSNVTNIPAYAFYNCNRLSSITIPSAVTNIGNYAFYGCSGLTTVNFNATNCTTMGSSSYPAFGSCNATATISIGANVTKIPEYAFNGLRGSGTLNIPETVTSIGNYAFSGCNGITAANLPDALQNIPVGLFYECSGLRSVNIPTSASSIGNYAFYGCNNLNGSIAIPNSVTSIGANAFYNCNAISSLSIGSAVSSIGSNAFYNCSGLTSITVDTSNTTYDSRDNCNAIITKSNNSLLLGCNNTVIPETVRSIGSSAFYNCSSLRRVNIPQQLTSLGNDAFAGCSAITEVVVNATSLNSNYTQSPFSAAQTSLKKISLGEGVTRLPNYMFAGCTALDTIIANPTVPPTIYSSTFDYNHVSSTRVIVPCRTADIYSDADFWYNFRRIKQNEPCPTIYTVTALSNNNLFGTVTGGGDYEENSTVTLSATANYGYRFAAWNDGNEENPRTISVTNDVTYIATFVEIPPVATYTITALSSNPTIGVVTGGGSYYEGTEVTLTATPSEGYAFVSWNDGETLNPRQITVSGDALYIASFIEANVVTNYEVNVASSNLAYGTVSGSGVYSLGNVVEISATAFDGYMFTSWNDGNTENPRSITVIGNAMYVANFAAIPPTPVYTITAMSINQAYGMVLGGGEYEENAIATLTATAANGYEFTSWNDGNTENPREVTVTRDAIYIAYFDELPQTPTYNITVIASNPNHGEVTGSGEYEENAVATLTATAANGYEFTSWNDGNTENPREVTVTRDAIYIAYFDELPSTPTYNITVIASNLNHGEVTGGGVYEENTEITLTATSFDGYRFDIWSDGNTDSIRTITVTSDAIYIANFVHIDEAETIYVTVVDTACGSYTWNGVTYTESGTYYRTFTATNSADSIVALGLVILTLPEPVITVDGILDACNQETTSVTLSAGNYSSYNWTTGETSSSIVVTTPGEYFVEVVDSMGCQGISEGVTIGYSTTLTNAPQIRKAGVKKNDNGPYFVAVNWSRVQGEGVVGYDVYREDAAANVFRFVKRVTSLSLIDSTVDPSARAYRYKVCAVDECGGLSPMSEPHKTIHLTINKGLGNAWNLIWSHYEGTPVRSYKIYRGTNKTNMSVIAEVPGNQNSYTDYDNPDCIGYYYKIDFVANTRSDGDEEDMLLSSNVVDNGYIVMHTVMAASSNPARGTVSGSGTYPAETVIELEATANSGYEFASWSDGNTDNPRSVTITSDTLFIANFVEIQQIAIYTITVYSSNPAYGTVSGGGTYAEGTEIQLVASANNGYEFVAWSDGNRDNPRTITVTEDAMYIATFAEAAPVVTYTVTVISANPSQGTVTGSGSYSEGTEITIEAIAAEGYEFISWDDNNTDNPRTITVTADAMYIASFTPVTGIEENYTIEINVFPNPAKDILNITSSETISEIEIVNVMGQIVKREEVNSDNVVCDVEDLRSGVYVVRIHAAKSDTSTTLSVRKFVKE